MYMVTPATEASMMAVRHFAKIFDTRKNGLQLPDDFVTELKDEFASNDPNLIFSTFQFRMMIWRDSLRCVRSKRTCYTT